MRYWWVNQNQTFRQEIEGGYLWSPKRNKNGNRNPFYEFMREVAPGDIVFSFCDTRIPALGIVSGYCRESPKPEEFGTTGTNWSQIGWRVGVRWHRLTSPVRPKDHIARLRPDLSIRYSPLTPDGNGLQSVYLTLVNPALAATLISLIGPEAWRVADVGHEVREFERDTPAPEQDIEEWEHRVEIELSTDIGIRETERAALIQARRGQGQYRDNLKAVERACRITKVERLEHLIASHVRPWRDSNNEQRLDGENGLLLTPTVDHLFDKGFISFEDSGRLIVSPVADPVSLKRMGIDHENRMNVGAFSEGQRRHLDFHRENVLRMAHVWIEPGRRESDRRSGPR
ncbi:MAG TPA: HNH endonuclease signature motif containing protein [Burkholderiaceae bacterium]|nr:HNH endonuclease signature motif containing protein [Burkholderiaceae bacterium]